MAAGEIYTFNETDAGRIAQAVVKSEEPDPVVVRPKRSALPAYGIIRAVLVEPLYGHGSALGVRCRRVREYQQQDVQLVGGLTVATDSWFRLGITWDRQDYVSDPISAFATPDEFLAALAPWTFVTTGDVWVSGGAYTPDLIPPQFAELENTAYIARWSVTFSGQQFDAAEVPQMEIHSQSIVGGGILISFPSAWVEDWGGEGIVELFEGGLMPDAPVSASSPPPNRTPLQPGSAVLAQWCPDAEGYVVCSAEARKYRVV